MQCKSRSVGNGPSYWAPVAIADQSTGWGCAAEIRAKYGWGLREKVHVAGEDDADVDAGAGGDGDVDAHVAAAAHVEAGERKAAPSKVAKNLEVAHSKSSPVRLGCPLVAKSCGFCR